jgi:hypothetical protein
MGSSVKFPNRGGRPSYRQEIYDLLKRGPKTSVELRAHIHQLRPECDWPQDGCIKAIICYMRKTLKEHGETIVSDGWGGYQGRGNYATYRIKRV